MFADELEIIGMQAHRYGATLAIIESGSIQPERLIGRTISLEQSIDALMHMDAFEERAVTVITML